MERFLPFVPSGPDAAEAALATSRDVEWLLTVEAQELWATTRSDGSLLALLESYLRTAPRPFDDGYAEQSPLELALWSQMAFVLEKMLVFSIQFMQLLTPSHSHLVY